MRAPPPPAQQQSEQTSGSNINNTKIIVNSKNQGYSFYVWSYSSPMYIKSLSESHQVQQVSCGQGRGNHQMAYVLTAQGELKEWNATSGTCWSDKKAWFSVPHSERFILQKPVLENVVSIVSGKGCHVATDSKGQVFVWGIKGKSLEDGRGYAWSYKMEPVLVKGLSGVQIKQVGVGWTDNDDNIRSDYCIVALTTTGDIYSWGKNQFGMTGLGIQMDEQKEPARVQGFEGKKVTQLATFQHHSAAITSDGSLYTWGCGSMGRLGHGDESNSPTPKLVQGIQGAKQVACGGEHTLALTIAGKVYAFGNNVFGQIGQGEKAEDGYLTPTLVGGLTKHHVIKVVCGKVSSYAITHGGKLLHWGDRIGQPIIATGFRDQRVEHIQCCGSSFAAFVTPRSDFVTLNRAFHLSVADDEFSDVTFVVENEPIRAHRIILARRCEFFHKMFTSGMRESREETIPLPGVSKSAFLLLLNYLYTDQIEVEIANALEIYQAAGMYQLPKLQDACEAATEERMTIQQAAIFLQEAHDCNCPELKEIGMSFVRENFAEVSQTSAMMEVTAELMLEIVRVRNLYG